jgi:hypothetical protein
VLGPEQGFRPRDGQVFELIREFLAAVVAPARIALRVLIGERRPVGAINLRIGVVLGRDQLDPLVLSALFTGQHLEHFGIVCLKQGPVVGHGSSPGQGDLHISRGPGERPTVCALPGGRFHPVSPVARLTNTTTGPASEQPACDGRREPDPWVKYPRRSGIFQA